MTVVAAHLGGMNLWDDVLRHIAGKYDNLYMDVGVVARYIEDDILLKIIRRRAWKRYCSAAIALGTILQMRSP